MQGFQHSHGSGLSRGPVLSAETTTDQGSPAPYGPTIRQEDKEKPQTRRHFLHWKNTHFGIVTRCRQSLRSDHLEQTSSTLVSVVLRTSLHSG